MAGPLAERGFLVHTLDMPGREGPVQGLGMACLERALGQTIAGCRQPPLVLAHSMAGVPLTALASRAPETLLGAIMLAAFVPGDGDSAAGLTRRLGLHDLERCLRPDAETGRVGMRRASARRMLYADVEPDVAEGALARLVDEPLAPMQDAVMVDRARLAAVPVHYLFCADDRLLPPARQQALAANWPGTAETLAGGHSPFLADPDRLADAIVRASESILNAKQNTRDTVPL